MKRSREIDPHFYVYILTNASGTLYVGITNDLERRVAEHREHLLPGFTAKFRMGKLLYHERYAAASDAIAREKQIK